MKIIIVLHLLFITSLVNAQESDYIIKPKKSFEIIGKPIKIGNLLVAEYDLEEVMNWYKARIMSSNLGSGWRLPTKNELNILFINNQKIRNLTGRDYWSSTESKDGDCCAWWQRFDDGTQWDGYNKSYNHSVRAVKSISK
jgi:hypothetical protein